jgi:hypothetical protein
LGTPIQINRFGAIESTSLNVEAQPTRSHVPDILRA